jgi:hypothetical protein
MNPRLLVLLVVLVILVVGLVYTIHSSTSPESAEADNESSLPVPGLNQHVDLPEGTEPDRSPEFECSIDLQKEGNHDVAYINVTESHGWWVNGVYVEFWHRKQDEDTGQWRRDTMKGLHRLSSPVNFKETFRDRVVLASHEFSNIHDFGTSENWECQVTQWDHVLAPPDGE